jgi:two-component system, response regulator PdtaR
LTVDGLGTLERLAPVALIVEDDPLLRMLAAEIAEHAGFVALEACDADEAVALMEVRSDIVLLFTDVQMPGSMDGVKLAHAVRDRWPPVKIIVASGHIRISLSELPSGSRFVAKPYSAEDMIAELRLLTTSRAPPDHGPSRQG